MQIERYDYAVVYTFQCALIAGVEFTKLAIATDSALRKKTNAFTSLQQFVNGLQALLALAGGDGHHTKSLEEWFEVPGIVDAFEHHKAYRSGAGDLHQRPINPRDVVSQHQGRICLGDVIEANYFYPVTALENPHGENTHQRVGQLAHSVTSTKHCHRRENIKKTHAVDTHK